MERFKAPKCVTCKKRLRKHEHHNMHGDYGDGAFCGMMCGYRWAVDRFNEREKQGAIFELEVQPLDDRRAGYEEEGNA